MSKILFISNDPAMIKKSYEIFRREGIQAEGTSSCLEGLVMMGKNGFSVVVIDDKLSDVSGYEACLKFKNWKRGARIVLLGVIPDSDASAREKELGFDLYLRKPVDDGELQARIKALLKRSGAQKDVAKAAAVKPAPARVPEAAAVSAKAKTVPAVPELKGKPEPNIPAGRKESRIKSIFKWPGSEKKDVKDAAIGQAAAAPAASSIPLNIANEKKAQPAVMVAEPAPFAANPAAELPDSTDMEEEQLSLEDSGSAILEDARVLKLVDALVSGRLPDIEPVIDFSYKKGFAYPSVNSLLDTSEVDTINILESLAGRGILIKQSYDKFYVDPDGLFQLVPIERCPRCDSSDIVRGQLVEHYSCGYVGLDRDFKQESRYVCPKCRKDLRLIGTDYRNVGIHYRCQDCNEVFTAPVVKWRNMKTRKIWAAEELAEVEVYSYQFSPDKKGWLEFQLKPKAQLVDFLKQQGYQVQELAQLTGRSGAVHTVDVLATRDDIITRINLGIGILVAPSGKPEVGLEALFRFDTRAYDIGINYKVVIAIPKLGLEALNFAGRQMIRAFEAKNLATVVSDITHIDSSNIGVLSGVAAGENNSGSVAANARSIIVGFLRNRGYDVYERALILGKSGIEHIFDIFARRDDKIVVPTVAIGIGSETGQPVGLDELSKFDAAAFDAGIRNKVFLGLSEISTQARQFAVQQKIDIIEQQDLQKLT
jgi:CheY-like chemotaxis protein